MFLPSLDPPKFPIAIYRTSSIGDVVLATACLNLLRHLGLSSQAIWLGRNPSLDLIKSSYEEVRCIEIAEDEDTRAGQRRLLEQLNGVQLFVDLQTNLRSKLLARVVKRDLGIPTVACRKNHLGRGRMVLGSRMRRRHAHLPRNVRYPAKLQFQMMLDALLEGLKTHLPPEFLDVADGFQATPHLPISGDEESRSWQKELKFGHWIAVAPGASYQAKQAPLAHFKDILIDIKESRFRAGALAEGEPLGLVFLGAKSERHLALRIFDEIAWPWPVLNLAGKVSLWESTLALKEVEFVMTNDSALSHVAEAVGTPSLVLFGPTVEGFGFSPWRQQSRAFSVDLGCRPCSKHGKVPCRFNDRRCFVDIPTSPIVSHCEGLLSE